MSDATAAPLAPAVADTSVQQTATTAAAEAPASGLISLTSEQLARRLDEAKERSNKALLRDLGVDDVKDAKAALAAYKAAQEAAKSEATKQAERIAALEPAAKRAAEIEADIATEMATELAALDEVKRAAVIAAAGSDPIAQRRVLRALRPTWTTAAPAPAPLAAPAATTAAAPAPAPAVASTDNALATYEALLKTSPGNAADYFLANWDAISKAQKTRA